MKSDSSISGHGGVAKETDIRGTWTGLRYKLLWTYFILL